VKLPEWNVDRVLPLPIRSAFAMAGTPLRQLDTNTVRYGRPISALPEKAVWKEETRRIVGSRIVGYDPMAVTLMAEQLN
jgi:hypothetical protein